MFKIGYKETPYDASDFGNQSYGLDSIISIGDDAYLQDVIRGLVRMLIISDYTNAGIAPALREIADEVENELRVDAKMIIRDNVSGGNND